MLPIVLGLAFAAAFGSVGMVIGVKMGRTIENSLTDPEREDVKTVMSTIFKNMNISEQNINQLSNEDRQEIAQTASQELINRWGEPRYREVENQIEEQQLVNE